MYFAIGITVQMIPPEVACLPIIIIGGCSVAACLLLEVCLVVAHSWAPPCAESAPYDRLILISTAGLHLLILQNLNQYIC